MAGMSRKEIARLLDHIEPQGVSATRTTKGVMLRFPDGKTTAMLHFTGSDVKEQHNVRARLRRHGITWPGDEVGPLPDWIHKRPQQRTLDRVQRVLDGWPQRYITGGQLSRALVADGQHAINSMTSQAVLFHLGWVPTGKSTARKWMRPLQLEPEPWPEAEAETVQPEANAQPDNVTQLAPAEPVELRPAARAVETERAEHVAPPALQLVPDATEAEPEAQPDESKTEHPAGREFIDTSDSWTVDPAELAEGLTVAQLFAQLRAFGLSGEVRVWRNDG